MEQTIQQRLAALTEMRDKEMREYEEALRRAEEAKRFLDHLSKTEQKIKALNDSIDDCVAQGAVIVEEQLEVEQEDIAL